MLTDSLPFPKCKIMIRLQSLELKSITKMEFHVPASQSMGKLHQVCDWLNEFSKHVCILLESNNCPFTNNNFDCCTSLNFLTCLTTLSFGFEVIKEQLFDTVYHLYCVAAFAICI